MYICQYQSPNSSHPPLPPAAATIYSCVSVPALQISSSISFFQIPYIYVLIYNICFSLSDLYGMTDSKFIHITTNDPVLFLFYDWVIFQHCFTLCGHLGLIQPANSSPSCRAQPKCHFLHDASPEPQQVIAACHMFLWRPMFSFTVFLMLLWHHQLSAFSLGDLCECKSWLVLPPGTSPELCRR